MASPTREFPSDNAGPYTGHAMADERETEDQETPLRPKFMRLRSRDFYGQFLRSPNGKYALGWRDAPDEGGVGGFRESGPGRYLLIESESERIIAEGCMARPNAGKIANDGTFILNDSGFGSRLSGVFSAFRSNGYSIITREFGANLLNNGLSDDGRFAACHTCSSDDADDSSMVIVFDLSRAIEIGRWHAESGWPDFYTFDSDRQTIGLGYRNLGVFRYSLTGEFIDRSEWIEACLVSDQPWKVLYMVERLLKDSDTRPSAELAEKLLPSIDRARLLIDDKLEEALGWKLRGVCLDATGAFREALEAYDNALRRNSKIGAKRRADQLRKIVRESQSPPSRDQ